MDQLVLNIIRVIDSDLSLHHHYPTPRLFPSFFLILTVKYRKFFRLENLYSDTCKFYNYFRERQSSVFPNNSTHWKITSFSFNCQNNRHLIVYSSTFPPSFGRCHINQCIRLITFVDSKICSLRIYTENSEEVTSVTINTDQTHS